MSSNITIASRPNPYIGTRPFKKGETLYGREQETSELYDLLISQRIVMMYSPSGAGKSSLLNAAILPLMEESGFEVLPTARVNHEPPAGAEANEKFNRYIFSLLTCFEDGIQPPEKRFTPQALATLSLKDYLARYRQRGPELDPGYDASRALLFVIDQGEEIINIAPTERAQKQDFFNQLGEVLRDRGLWLLFSLREDYVARLDSYIKPIPTGFSSRYRLRLLQPKAAMQAIQKPPTQQNVTFTDKAAHTLIEDLRQMQVQQPDGTSKEEPGLYVEPVHLQVVCHRLWGTLNRADNEIGVEDLKGIENVNAALADYYKLQVAVVSAKTGVRERAIREWFDRKLITQNGVRSQVLLAPQKSDGLENSAIYELERRYLVRSEQRGGLTWFELSHDRLITPVRENNDEWFKAHLSTLQRAADAWNQGGRAEGFLLFGKDYLEAEAWAGKNQDLLLDFEETFLNECRKHHQRMLQDQRTNRIVRNLLVVSVVAFAIALFLFYQATRAENRAETEQLAASSISLLKTDPPESLLQAVEAMQNTSPPLPSAIDALHRSLPAMRLVRTYYGHTDRVYGVAYSPDGKLLASASRDGTVRIWDTTGQELEALHTFEIDLVKGVGNVAFSPDGALLATVDRKGEIILWNTSTWQEVRRKTGAHDGTIWGLAFSPDGKLLLTGGEDNLVKLWNVADLSEIHTFSDHRDIINAVAFSPDGSLLASASSDRSARVWRVADYSLVGSFTVRQNILSNPPRMMSVTFNLDSSRLISTNTDGNAYVWDLQSGEQIMKIGGHDDWVYGVLVRPGSDADAVQGEIITAGADRSIRIWGGLYGRSKLELRGHTDQVYGLALNPLNDGQLASASADGTLRVWDISWSGNAERYTSDIETEIGMPGYAEDVDFNPTGDLLAIPVSLPRNPTDNFPNLAQPGEILLVNPLTGQLDGVPLTGHAAAVFNADFNQDGSRLVSASQDKTVIIWDVNERSALTKLVHDSQVYTVKYSDDGRWIATGTEKGEVWLWEASQPEQPLKKFTEQEIRGEAADNAAVVQVDFLSDNTLAVLYREGLEIYLIDAQTGQLKMTLAEHEDIVRDIDENSDGTLLVSAGDDASLILWDLRPGILDEDRDLHVYKEHLATVFTVTFATIGDKEYLLSAGADGIIKVWEPTGATTNDWQVSYELRAYAFANDDTILDIEISPANDYEIVAVVNDWTLRSFSLSNDELIALAQKRLRANLDCGETDLSVTEQEICHLNP